MPFSIDGMDSKDIAINLEKILPALAKNLYGDDWRISIRELLQNCNDALVPRGSKTTDALRIDVIPDAEERTLTFKNNGIGMSLEEVEKQLATVGASDKRTQIERLIEDGVMDRSALDSIIGSYGIGFLSAFIIADQVEVLTRSQIGDKAGGVRAIFTGETRWYFSRDLNATSGTQIKLKLRQNLIDPSTGSGGLTAQLLNFERLKEEVRRFGDLLPYPIFVHRSPMDFDGDLCNTIKGPWESDPFNTAAFQDYLRARRPNENAPITALSFSFDRIQHGVSAHGLLYFPRVGRNSNSSDEPVSKVELMCRRMFITDDLQSLLPPWATFVCLLVECPDLTPTLDRNKVISHTPSFVALKQALGQKIITVLKNMAQNQPQTFNEIRNEHRLRLYGALYQDYDQSPVGESSFFRSLIDFIPFTVIQRSAPAGEQMTLRKYRDEVSRRQSSRQKSDSKDQLYYLHDAASMGQFRADDRATRSSSNPGNTSSRTFSIESLWPGFFRRSHGRRRHQYSSRRLC